MTRVSDLFPAKYRDALEQELRSVLSGQEGLLDNMLLYQLGWMDEQGNPMSGLSGERLHPLLCFLSCESLAGDYEAAPPAAAAVELVHNYSLIHEDVQAGSPNRGDRPTIWWIWGPGQAINAGDGMHALARLALMRLQERGMPVARVMEAMRLMDQSCLTMCEGQYLDLSFQEKLDVGVEPYLKMAAGRTGALMSCAMGLGALAATEDGAAVEAFKKCGENIGVAYQMRRDIDDLQGSRDGGPSGDVLNKKKLLPIVYAMATGDVSLKRELGTIYFKRVLEPPDVEQVTGILARVGALEYTQKRVQEYCVAAIDSLKGVAVSSSGLEELDRLCQTIISGEG